MKRRFVTFYPRHPLLSLHLCALLLWLFINIGGAFILHLSEKNKLDSLFGSMLMFSQRFLDGKLEIYISKIENHRKISFDFYISFSYHSFSVF